MLIIGLTGSIATGKSTVSSLLKTHHNLPIIDADHLAHAVVLPGTPAYRSIISHFGDSTPNLLYQPFEDPFPSSHGPSINRKVLGQRVFGTTEENKRDIKILNGIVHPAVRKAMWKEVVYYWLRGHWAVVLDIPLLFEAGLDMFCGVTIVVGTSPEIQMARLMERDKDKGLSKEDAERRVASQMAVETKKMMADVVIWNDGSLEELKGEVAKAVRELKKGRGMWWTWALAGCWPVTFWVVLWRLFGNYMRKKRRAAARKQN